MIKVYEYAKLQKFLILTGHIYLAHLCLANLAWYEKLPATDQAATEQRARNRASEAAFLAELKAAGMQVEEHPDRAYFMQQVATLEQSPLMQAPGAKATLAAFREALK